MKFKINDRVSVLDDDLSGRVIEVSWPTVTIETTAGFELSFEASELVKIKDNLLNTSSFSGQSLQKILSEKGSKKRAEIPKKKTNQHTT